MRTGTCMHPEYTRLFPLSIPMETQFCYRYCQMEIAAIVSNLSWHTQLLQHNILGTLNNLIVSWCHNLNIFVTNSKNCCNLRCTAFCGFEISLLFFCHVSKRNPNSTTHHTHQKVKPVPCWLSFPWHFRSICWTVPHILTWMFDFLTMLLHVLFLCCVSYITSSANKFPVLLLSQFCLSYFCSVKLS